MLIGIFLGVFSGLLLFDLYWHRNDSVISLGAAVRWSIFYIAMALAFAVVIAITQGQENATRFLAGYLMEKALSVDNLVVFGAVFAYFAIPDNQQHRILYYGIIGASLLRLLFVIAVGGPLYLFGRPVEVILAVIVAYSAYKIVQGGESDEIDHVSRWYGRITARLFGAKATPFVLCLVSIEFTDVMFAFDSVPTVVSISQDPILIYSAMMFAVLGLRSMYFILAALQRVLTYLTPCVIIVLGLVSLKLLAHGLLGYEVSPILSLGIIAAIFTCGIGLSLVKKTIAKDI